MFNKSTLVGRIGQIYPVKISNSGVKILNFTVATNDYSNGQKITDWHDITAFGKTADFIESNFSVGQAIIVEGPSKRNMVKHVVDGVEKNVIYPFVIAQTVRFAGPKPQNQGQPNYQNQAPQQNQAPVQNQAPQQNQVPQQNQAPQPNYQNQAPVQNQAPQQNNAPQQNQAPQGQNGGFDDFDDEIPF